MNKKDKLVWERTCDYVIEDTNWQCSNQARVNGQGPVVAVVTRRTNDLGNFIFDGRINGKTIVDLSSYWGHSLSDMRKMEKLIEEHYYRGTTMENDEPVEINEKQTERNQTPWQRIKRRFKWSKQ